MARRWLSYLGGHTIIGPNSRTWFGFGGRSPIPTTADAHEKALARLQELLASKPGGRHRRRKIAQTQREVERTRPLPREKRRELDISTEQRIAELKRLLVSREVRKNRSRHETLRLELIGLLDACGLPTSRYSEAAPLEDG